METARTIGDCHYCDKDVVEVLAGQYGPDEVWVRRHADELVSSHAPRTSDEVWADDEIDETSSPNYGLS